MKVRVSLLGLCVVLLLMCVERPLATNETPEIRKALLYQPCEFSLGPLSEECQ